MSIVNLLNKQTGRLALTAASAVCVFSLAINTASAGDREKAKFIHDRIAGVPPETIAGPGNDVLDLMEQDITGGNVAAAITRAMNDPNFLNVKVKNMVIPWTNEDQTVFAPLNDTAATIIGYIRDGRDFRGILSDDLIYVGVDPALNSFPYSNSNNDHYIQMEHQNLNLRTVLQSQTQSSTIGQPAEAVAGITTTRANARAFFYGGTNRAMFRFTMMNYLCTDLEEVKDITRTNNYVRQDVSRSPGGDSEIFLNNCVGCHAGMDGMAGAYAYHQWGPNIFDDNNDADTQSMLYQTTAITYQVDGVDIEAPTRVTHKHRINPTNFEYGWVTPDDRWTNYWRTGQNAKLGWANNTTQAVRSVPASTPGAAVGNAALLGQELANTTAFARCQVLKVYRHVCLSDPAEATLQTLTTNFVNSTYDMRTVFTDSVINCMNSNPNL